MGAFIKCDAVKVVKCHLKSVNFTFKQFFMSFQKKNDNPPFKIKSMNASKAKKIKRIQPLLQDPADYGVLMKNDSIFPLLPFQP